MFDLQDAAGPEPSAKDKEAAAAISASAAAASARQQRKAIPVQGDFFMPGDEAGVDGAAVAAEVCLSFPIFSCLRPHVCIVRSSVPVKL